MNKKERKITHLVLLAVFLFSFIWLGYENAVPDGVVSYSQDFQSRTPFVSDLWPPERVDSIIPSPEGAVRPVVEGPVSFFVQPPRAFGSATIFVTFKLQQPAVMEFAYKSGEEPNAYQAIVFDQLEAIEGGWWRGAVTINVDDWHSDKNRRYNARIDVPELLQTKNVLWIRDIRVDLYD